MADLAIPPHPIGSFGLNEDPISIYCSRLIQTRFNKLARNALDSVAKVSEFWPIVIEASDFTKSKKLDEFAPNVPLGKGLSKIYSRLKLPEKIDITNLTRRQFARCLFEKIDYLRGGWNFEFGNNVLRSHRSTSIFNAIVKMIDEQRTNNASMSKKVMESELWKCIPDKISGPLPALCKKTIPEWVDVAHSFLLILCYGDLGLLRKIRRIGMSLDNIGYEDAAMRKILRDGFLTITQSNPKGKSKKKSSTAMAKKKKSSANPSKL